ncbi:MAG: Hpt domain-containing protein [Phycisphaerales bacterium JB059]
MADEQGAPSNPPIVSEFAGDPDMVEIVEYFVGELPKRVDALRRAASSNDTGTLATLAHQLKGAAPGYGFSDIGRVAGELEAALRSSASIENVIGQIEDLASLCERARSKAR